MNLITSWRRLRAQRSLGLDATLTAATNVTIALMGLCTGVISARLLGPSGRGQLAAIQAAPSFVATLAMVGAPEALVYYSALQPDRAGRYLGTASAIALVASIPCMAAAYLLMPMVLAAQGAGVISAARWYLLIAPVWALVGMMYHPLRGHGDFWAWNELRLAVPLCALGVLGIAFLLGRVTPAYVAIGYLISYALLFIPSAWSVRRRLAGPFTPQAANILPMLRFGLPCVMTGLPQMLNLRLDQMLMAALLPSYDLGLYVVAVAWSGAVSPVLTSIGAGLLPSLASAGCDERAAARLRQGVRMTTALAFAVCAAVAAAAPIAIPFLFGRGYQAALGAALILIPASGVLGINFSLQEGLRGLGRPYDVLFGELCGLTVTAATLLLLLRPLGILGAAVASLLGYSTVMIALLRRCRELTGVGAFEMLRPQCGEFKAVVGRLLALVHSEAFPT